MSKDQIIKDIESWRGNVSYSKFYIGITDDVARRFSSGEHNVRQGDANIYRTANSKAMAQEVEEHFLAKGMDGDTGGGNDSSVYVYCYQKNSHTNP